MAIGQFVTFALGRAETLFRVVASACGLTLITAAFHRQLPAETVGDVVQWLGISSNDSLEPAQRWILAREPVLRHICEAALTIMCLCSIALRTEFKVPMQWRVNPTIVALAAVSVQLHDGWFVVVLLIVLVVGRAFSGRVAGGTWEYFAWWVSDFVCAVLFAVILPVLMAIGGRRREPASGGHPTPVR